MKRLLSVCCALSAIALSGCVTLSTDFELSCADKLTPGVSTKADAKLACGWWNSHERVYADGQTDMSWEYESTVFSNHDKRLHLLFDKDGKFVSIIGKSQR